MADIDKETLKKAVTLLIEQSSKGNDLRIEENLIEARKAIAEIIREGRNSSGYYLVAAIINLFRVAHTLRYYDSVDTRLIETLNFESLPLEEKYEMLLKRIYDVEVELREIANKDQKEKQSKLDLKSLEEEFERFKDRTEKLLKDHDRRITQRFAEMNEQNGEFKSFESAVIKDIDDLGQINLELERRLNSLEKNLEKQNDS